MPDNLLNPADEAAQRALEVIYECIDNKKSFLLEAGAGAGKTYSLVEALKYLIQKMGSDLLRQHQQVACITYTNVATEEIRSRTDSHPVILSSTIHSFCWSLIKDFQPSLRKELPQITAWIEKLKEAGGLGKQRIGYDEFGHRAINENNLSLHHDDVLTLTIKLMQQKKFRTLLISRYPILFIDEYQDTDKLFTEALKTYFLEQSEGLLIGFFGDHWQKIYGSGCGKILHPSLQVIKKESNFRSAPRIVEALNRIRIELPQQVADPAAEGSVEVYHTNNSGGPRRTGQHWEGDLFPDMAHLHLEALKKSLAIKGWDFSPEKTKILMLTHRGLANEQGYKSLLDIFPYNDAFIKKENSYIAFLADTIEPVCNAYEKKRYGEMFSVLGRRTPAIQSHEDKVSWKKDLDKLVTLRLTSTVGAVIDHIKCTNRPYMPDALERKEHELSEFETKSIADESKVALMEQVKKLKQVPYQEIISLTKFINGYTPFETKHGVKGAEFENVLVIFGRGWNQYDFNQFLEWAGNPGSIPAIKQETFERNRNLFYVACSRAKTRLAILFTQQLSNRALSTLASWFGNASVQPLSLN